MKRWPLMLIAACLVWCLAGCSGPPPAEIVATATLSVNTPLATTAAPPTAAPAPAETPAPIPTATWTPPPTLSPTQTPAPPTVWADADALAEMAILDQWGGRTQGIASLGEVAYVGIGPRVAALSVADPAAMAILGLSPVLPGIVTALEPAGELLYASLDSGNIVVLDIEERTSPVIVNGLSLGAPIMDLALAGDLMIAVGGTRELGRMWILARVASGQPELAGEVPLPGSGTSVTAAGAIAYVTHAEGLSTYDLAQATAPMLLDEMQTREAALTILLEDDIAYLAAGNLKIVDATAPTGMEELGQHFDGYNYVSALAMSRDGLYVLESGCEFSGCWAFLTLLDVSDPAVPVERAFTLIPGVGGGELVVQNDLVYVVTWAGLRAFRLTAAGELVPAGELTQSGLVSDIILHPELALLYAANEQGIAVLDMAEATPRLLTHFPFDGEFPAGGLAIIRDVLFVSVYNLGLNLLDISQPEAPAWIDQIEQVELVINDGAIDLIPDGSYLYMNSWRKLVLADVVDPANPVAIGQFATEGQGILSVAHRGAQVALGEYHTNGDPGGTLRLLDVADPAEPQELASLGLPCAVRDVAFVEAFIYALLGTCADGEAPARLALVEVGPAGELTLVAFLPLAGPDVFAPVTAAGQMTLYGDRLYIAADDLLALDVSDPRQPRRAAQLVTPGYAHRVVVVGERLYVADDVGGVLVVRVGVAD